MQSVSLILTMPSALHVCCIHSNVHMTIITVAKTINSDQTVLMGAAKSGSILFVILATKVHMQLRKQMALVLNGEKRVKKRIHTFI